MFFEYKKAKNMHKANEKLHIFGLLILFDIEEKLPLITKICNALVFKEQDCTIYKLLILY